MEFVALVIRGLTFLIIIDAVLSWIMPGRNQFPRNVTGTILEPLYRPIRSIIDPAKTGGIDLSPLILIFGLQGIASLILRAF